MSQEVIVHQKPVVDRDDRIGTVNVAASGVATPVVWGDTGLNYFRTRTGRRARLTFLGNAVDPGGESFITFHVLVNGAKLLPPYDSFTQALGETFNGWASLSLPVELPQNAMVQVIADNSDSANAYNVYNRVRIEYEDLN